MYKEKSFGFPLELLSSTELSQQDKVVGLIVYSLQRKFDNKKYYTNLFTENQILELMAREKDYPSRRIDVKSSIQNLQEKFGFKIFSMFENHYYAELPKGERFIICYEYDFLRLFYEMKSARKDKLFSTVLVYALVNQSVSKKSQDSDSNRVFYKTYDQVMCNTDIKTRSTISHAFKILCEIEALDFVKIKYNGAPFTEKNIYTIPRFKKEILAYANGRLGTEYSSLLDWSGREDELNNEFK